MLRKFLKIIIMWLIILLIGASCTENKKNNSESLEDFVSNENHKSNIHDKISKSLDTNKPLSNNNIQIELNEFTVAYKIITPKNNVLRLVLTEGKISEVWNCEVFQPEFFGHDFVGKYKLIYETCTGEVIDSLDLSMGDFGDELRFKNMFEFKLTDYNKDGYIDFTIGQFLTTSNWRYKIFTIKNDRIIDLTSFSNGIVVQRGDISHSIILETDGISITSKIYDRIRGKYFVRSYLWNIEESQYNYWEDTYIE